jgi:hypothetical protein
MCESSKPSADSTGAARRRLSWFSVTLRDQGGVVGRGSILEPANNPLKPKVPDFLFSSVTRQMSCGFPREKAARVTMFGFSSVGNPGPGLTGAPLLGMRYISMWQIMIYFSYILEFCFAHSCGRARDRS